MNISSQTTIAAIATPPGRGGIGVIRVSGPQAVKVAEELLGNLPSPRYAHYSRFFAADGSTIDAGIALYFPGPHSFTGEDVLELQGHGGPVVLDMLLERILSLGLQQARPGEFSERAFLNGKMDLVQAEAVADLIDAASGQAARSALRSLQGEFSARIDQLVAAVTQLRIYVEAAIDFPTEEIDFLADQTIARQLTELLSAVTLVEEQAQQGMLLRDGMHLVIAGRPNAGKSSLLNRLSGQETAIVTEIAGTTRDILRCEIQIDGLPLHIIDTAGLRISEDPVEKEGILRAQKEIQQADRILLVIDSTQASLEDVDALFAEMAMPPITAEKLIIVSNKIDILHTDPTITPLPNGSWQINLSAKTGAGLDLLREHLKSSLGYVSGTDNTLSARRRHLTALALSKQHIQNAVRQLQYYQAGELLAEELRLAQNALAEITGTVLPDDLLGQIFGSFCIGK